MAGHAPSGRATADDVERVFRDVYGQAVATLVRHFGDITQAEDAVQDAFVVASDRWVREGVPPNPAGWIVTTARRRAIDVMRREARGRELQRQLGTPTNAAMIDIGGEDESVVDDDQLRLIFTCCHPALRTEHQVALTLRLLGGLSVEEIARAFLVGEAAMAKRLVRAKYKIKAANIPYRIPSESDLPVRLRSVMAVLYLIYNAGVDDPQRAALRSDAIRLARALSGLMPDQPEVAGLLALMLLSEARGPARVVDGDAVLLKDQDRARWDRALIQEGHAIVRACIRREQPGPYQLQAAIQAVHCDAATYADTDWVQIVALYDHLHRVQPSPVVAMNRAIAVAEVDGAAAGLAALDDHAAALSDYHLWHAARGSMLQRLSRFRDAEDAFVRAAGLAATAKDRTFLKRQIRVVRREAAAQEGGSRREA